MAFLKPEPNFSLCTLRHASSSFIFHPSSLIFDLNSLILFFRYALFNRG
jgi:hypothetical protein